MPARQLQWLTSWVFFAASAFLTLEFVLLAGPAPDFPLVNLFGMFSCVLWFQGFILLNFFLVYEIPFDLLTVLGGMVKLLASIFFNLQPASGLLGYNGGAGYAWTNFTGICLFHAGNLISCVAMRGMFDSKNPTAEANLPVWGMWVYTLATTLLVTSDGLDFFHIENGYVHFGQIAGATLLGAGSLIYAYCARPAWYLTRPRSGSVNFD